MSGGLGSDPPVAVAPSDVPSNILPNILPTPPPSNTPSPSNTPPSSSPMLLLFVAVVTIRHPFNFVVMLERAVLTLVRMIAD